MVTLRTRNKITDFLMILAWASPFNNKVILIDSPGGTVARDCACESLGAGDTHLVVRQMNTRQ